MTKEERKEYDHQRYLINREKIKEQSRQYYQNNKENVLERNKEYSKQWYQDNKEEKAEYNIQYYNTKIGRGNCFACHYRQKDKLYNRGECTITGEWMVDNIFSGQRCFYCGETDWKELGCDRINNDLPHTPDNVVCCCEECNTKRGRKSFEEFCKEMGVTIASEAIF